MKALITGITGQDGAYLAQFLLEKGYEVHGADNKHGGHFNWRLKYLKIEDKIKIHTMDLIEYTNILDLLKEVKPDEIYNFAALSFVQSSFKKVFLTSDINAMGTLRMLEAIRAVVPNVKFFQASSSEMFGNAQTSPQNEATPFHPQNPYGTSKLFAHWATINYRESYDIFACSGILFNHESPLRGSGFVTKKISQGIARIKSGQQDKIVVGNIDSKRDWGYAKEYVEAMWLMLQQETPDDFILATGNTHTVREFIEISFKCVDIKIQWQGEGINEKGIDKESRKTLVEVSSDYYRTEEKTVLVGDPSKAKNVLKWQPKTSFEALVNLMVSCDMKVN